MQHVVQTLGVGSVKARQQVRRWIDGMLAQARGRWHDLATHAGPVKALVSIPPSYLVNHPKAKAHAWADLQKLVEEVKQ